MLDETAPLLDIQGLKTGFQTAQGWARAVDGIDLKLDWAKDTLESIHAIWSRPVHLETVIEDKRKLLTFDGNTHSEKEI